MLTSMIIALSLQAGPSGSFNYIRIGDEDGFGYLTGTDPCGSEPCWPFGSWNTMLDGSCSGFQLINAVGAPVNVDGVGVLGAGDFLPNLDCSPETRYDSDEFDLRTAYELSGGPYGFGVQVNGATSTGSMGSGWTDVAVSGTGLGWLDCGLAPPPPHDYICNNGQAVFIFDFEVASADPTQPLYINALFADYDVDSTSDILRYTTASGSVIDTTIATQDNTAGEDGLIQEATAVIPFADVFPNWSGGDQTGYLKVEFQMPSEPFVAYDYVELSIAPLIDPEGCCCYQDETTWLQMEQTEADCLDMGGSYAGDGVPCIGGEFPELGACCLPQGDGTLICIDTAICDCDAQGGDFYPVTPCSQAPCAEPDPEGCCCYQPPGSSIWYYVQTTEFTCEDMLGIYLGDGTVCEGDVSPMGACCLESENGLYCFETSECNCIDLGGDFYLGLGCKEVECDPVTKEGACCYIDIESGCYECVMVESEEECKSLPNRYRFPKWQGFGTSCTDANMDCCRILGACCIDGICAEMIEEACLDAGGTWSAYDQCASVACPGDDCEADVNGDGTVNVLDLLSVISEWGDCP
jgi:hypothetical protein